MACVKQILSHVTKNIKSREKKLKTERRIFVILIHFHGKFVLLCVCMRACVSEYVCVHACVRESGCVNLLVVENLQQKLVL